MLNIEDFADGNEQFDGHYALIRPLSVDGATADVWLALDTNTVMGDVDVADIARLDDGEIEKLGLIVAIKIYRPHNALDIEGEKRFRDEYMIVFNCHHTNLIHPSHFSIFKETPYLVLPYCKLGSSELLIGNLRDSDSIWRYILDVSSGLAYLHALTPPIIHQDIKPANILLDDTHHYAITDFGISAQKGGSHHDGYYDENSGTLAYMAPERFQEEVDPMPQSDIWAFGATLYEILTGKVPFGEDGGQVQAESDMPVLPIEGVSADIQRLIQACLAKEPGDRPTAAKIAEAAKAKQYPVRSKKPFIYGLLFALAVFIAGSSYYFAKMSQDAEEIVEVYNPSTEELFAWALDMMNNDTIAVFRSGLNLMDSIGNNNYIPALNELAFTYGWYSDFASKNRKKLLQIEIDHYGVPKDVKYINKAVGLFQQILDQKDSLYPKINADANYRLAWYYNERNDNKALAKEYLQKSRDWAVVAQDESLIQKIDKQLGKFVDIK